MTLYILLFKNCHRIS